MKVFVPAFELKSRGPRYDLQAGNFGQVANQLFSEPVSKISIASSLERLVAALVVTIGRLSIDTRSLEEQRDSSERDQDKHEAMVEVVARGARTGADGESGYS